MTVEEMDRNIDQVIQEGLSGITRRDHRTNKAISLEQGAQARYFSRLRNDMNSFASSRVMTVGVSKSANALFKEISLE